MSAGRKWFSRIVVLVSLAAGLSALVLGIASYRVKLPAAGLWVRSDMEKPEIHGAVVDGSMYLVYAAPRKAPGAGDTDHRWGPFQLRRRLLGTTLALGMAAPFWLVAPALWVPAGVQLARGPWRRSRRRRRGLCLSCGYDLRASPGSRCPECGVTPDARTPVHVEVLFP